MYAQAIPAALARALALYVLAGSLGLTLWLELPAWAPGFVLRTSPFVLPAARAAVAGHDAQGFARRVDGWGTGAVPGLCNCLRHHQVLVRRLAAQVIAAMAAHGALDARLIPALIAACDDDDDGVARWARRALHRDGLAPSAASPSAAAAAAGAPARSGDAPARAGAHGKAAGADDDDEDDVDDDDDMPSAPPAGKPH
jgi:hypothetical protein